MICPKCGGRMSCTDSREVGRARVRRYVCAVDGSLFTLERPFRKAAAGRRVLNRFERLTKRGAKSAPGEV